MADFNPSVDRPLAADPKLQAIAIGWGNGDMIADQVLPRKTVTDEDFQYTKYDRSQLVTVPPSDVSRRGRVTRLDFSSSTDTASVSTYGYEVAIPYSDIRKAEIANAPDPKGLAVESMQQLIALDREQRCAGVVFNAATYAADHKETLAGETKFSHANSNPIDKIKQIMDSAKMPLNTLVIGAEAWAALSTHPDLVSAYNRNRGDKGIVPPQFLSILFDSLKSVVVGRAWINTNKKGAGENLARVWGPHIALMHLDGNPTQMGSATFGFTAEFGQRFAGQWESKDIGLDGGVMVRTGERVGEVIAAPDYGYLIRDVV